MKAATDDRTSAERSRDELRSTLIELDPTRADLDRIKGDITNAIDVLVYIATTVENDPEFRDIYNVLATHLRRILDDKEATK